MGNSSSQAITPRCGICELQSVSKPSLTWCFDCHEELCQGCSKHHSLSKASNNHNTIPIEEYRNLPSIVKTLKPYCTKHNEKYTKFCKNHDCLCCDDCVTQSHQTCKDWSQVEDAIRNVKNSNACSEVEKLLEEVSSNIQNAINDKQLNLHILSDKRDDIESWILQIRHKIDTHLDKLQMNLITKLHEEETNCSDKIHQLIERLTEDIKPLEEFRMGLDGVKKCVPELEFITAMKEIESQALKNQDYLDDLLENGSLNLTELSFTVNEKVKTMFSSLHTFGAVNVKVKPSSLKIIKAKTIQAQMLKPNSPVNLWFNLKLIAEDFVVNVPPFRTLYSLIKPSKNSEKSKVLKVKKD